MLRSDGTSVACGSNEEGRCDLPAPVAGLGHAQAAAGARYTGLLGSDVGAVPCASNEGARRNLLALVA